MKDNDKLERGRLANEFLGSFFFKNFFENAINEDIANAININKIDDKDILNSYFKQKVKSDVYRGILNKLKTWKDEYKKLKKTKGDQL